MLLLIVLLLQVYQQDTDIMFLQLSIQIRLQVFTWFFIKIPFGNLCVTHLLCNFSGTDGSA